jgi:hypothetical protein
MLAVKFIDDTATTITTTIFNHNCMSQTEPFRGPERLGPLPLFKAPNHNKKKYITDMKQSKAKKSEI